jgi:hypothetical protein
MASPGLGEVWWPRPQVEERLGEICRKTPTNNLRWLLEDGFSLNRGRWTCAGLTNAVGVGIESS